MADNNVGKITQIISAVLDIKFQEGNLPEINEAINVPLADEINPRNVQAKSRTANALASASAKSR